MDFPLESYYISSTRQILVPPPASSWESLAGLQRVLLMGCRAVELEISDGKNGKPRVMCGGLWDIGMSVDSVLNAIKRCAFLASHYPVILCIKNNCSRKQTSLLVKSLRSHLGRQLATRPKNCKKPVTPQSLFERFIIIKKQTDWMQSSVDPNQSRRCCSMSLKSKLYDDSHRRQGSEEKIDKLFDSLVESSSFGKSNSCDFGFCSENKLDDIAFMSSES